ncbi:MAG TPA: 2-oxo-4-hydroxy-4-carboxy-5-ureidoimidazoline decarboxylase, partial [Burkholderiaceae bacterium]
MPLTTDQLNTATPAQAVALLDGVYEHSPWVAEQALAARPFLSLQHLKHVLEQAVSGAPAQQQLALIRMHPELAGKAMQVNALTAESAHEQGKAGLTQCTAEELMHIRQLNSDYGAKFGFPFVLAVRGPRGVGLAKQAIIATFERRLGNHPDFERAEALRNIHRIAEIRLNDKFGVEPTLGNQVWDWQEQLAVHSDPGFAEQGLLTVTYLTDAHRACAAQIAQWMRECGFDEVAVDAVGNVVGRYYPAAPGENAKYLITGSHFDTVRNGGKYDGRLGIFVPLACVRELHRTRQRLPFGIELVAFAEEEGQRYKATFLG